MASLRVGKNYISQTELVLLSEKCVDGNALADRILKIPGCETMDSKEFIAIIKWFNAHVLENSNGTTQ